MTFNDVENLLAVRLGFDTHSVGRKAVESVIRHSMKDAGFSDPAAYARRLDTDSNAWNSLVDRVVISETWFFRDVAPFELAADVARAHAREVSGRTLRVLSCPSSTGEEPYSLVMTILHAGVPAESFTVDALDVSQHALKSAQAAVFGKRSFRDHSPWYRVPYFDYAKDDHSWRLRDSVASRVQFRDGNLIAPDFLRDEEPYDLVFCRNLLIYLHSEARLTAMATLRRVVGKEGVLVLGNAETALAREHGFTPTGPAAAFAFVKNGSRFGPKSRSAARRHAPSGAPPTPRIVEVDVVPPVQAAPAFVGAPPTQDPDLSLLVIARQLGDAGQLHDALRLCGEHVKRTPSSAEGHFLLGVLHDALGHMDLAVASFRKVLYLNPSHREALLHLALKQEARGDYSGAALLRERARRSPEDLATE